MNTNFFSLINIVTLLLSVLFIVFGIYSIKKNKGYFGRKVVISLLLGFVICITATIRDGYGFSNDSIISFDGNISALFSILGGIIVLISVSLIFNNNIQYRKLIFVIVNIIFVIKLILMELIRLSVLL